MAYHLDNENPQPNYKSSPNVWKVFIDRRQYLTSQAEFIFFGISIQTHLKNEISNDDTDLKCFNKAILERFHYKCCYYWYDNISFISYPGASMMKGLQVFSFFLNFRCWYLNDNMMICISCYLYGTEGLFSKTLISNLDF